MAQEPQHHPAPAPPDDLLRAMRSLTPTRAEQDGLLPTLSRIATIRALLGQYEFDVGRAATNADYSWREIAYAMGEPHATVYRRLGKAER